MRSHKPLTELLNSRWIAAEPKPVPLHGALDNTGSAATQHEASGGFSAFLRGVRAWRDACRGASPVEDKPWTSRRFPFLPRS